MSAQQNSANPHANDGKVDAIAAIAVIALVVTTLVFWLTGM